MYRWIPRKRLACTAWEKGTFALKYSKTQCGTKNNLNYSPNQINATLTNRTRASLFPINCIVRRMFRRAARNTGNLLLAYRAHMSRMILSVLQEFTFNFNSFVQRIISFCLLTFFSCTQLGTQRDLAPTRINFKSTLAKFLKSCSALVSLYPIGRNKTVKD